jgi:hypothetical protein
MAVLLRSKVRKGVTMKNDPMSKQQKQNVPKAESGKAVDKREQARNVHTNHFTSRAPEGSD